MLDANYLRTQAALSFEIARTLSDRAAAERLHADAMGYLLRAEDLEEGRDRPVGMAVLTPRVTIDITVAHDSD